VNDRKCRETERVTDEERLELKPIYRRVIVRCRKEKG